MHVPGAGPSAKKRRQDARLDLDEFFDQFQAAAARGDRLELQSPAAIFTALFTAARMPVLRVATSDGPDGDALRRELIPVSVRYRTPIHAVTGVIVVPDDLPSFAEGAAMQTLRRKVREADRRGITWEPVTDPAQRAALIDAGDEYERTGAPEPYRMATADNTELVGHGLWLLARSADGAPLLLSVTPVDGSVGVLRYFRTFTSGPDASAARYLMTKVLVEQLHSLGVRHVVDNSPSIRLPHGLRHFQKMVGFTQMRVRVERPRRVPRDRRSSKAPAEDPTSAVVSPVILVEQYEAVPAVRDALRAQP